MTRVGMPPVMSWLYTQEPPPWVTLIKPPLGESAVPDVDTVLGTIVDALAMSAAAANSSSLSGAATVMAAGREEWD